MIKEDRVEKKTGPDLPRSTRTEETEETVENLIMSQEVEPQSHLSPRQIEKSEGISRSSVVRIVRDKSIANFKRSKTTMKKGARKSGSAVLSI